MIRFFVVRGLTRERALRRRSDSDINYCRACEGYERGGGRWRRCAGTSQRLERKSGPGAIPSELEPGSRPANLSRARIAHDSNATRRCGLGCSAGELFSSADSGSRGALVLAPVVSCRASFSARVPIAALVKQRNASRILSLETRRTGTSLRLRPCSCQRTRACALRFRRPTVAPAFSPVST